MSPTLTTPAHVDTAVANVVRWLETAQAPDGMLAADCFLDLSLPQWRIQAGSAEAALAIRRQSHPFPGTVRVERVDRTDRGFVMAFEERWDHEGQRWYCREQIRADVVHDTIVEMAVYCTGDWDEARQAAHAADVSLLRP
ncbi:MAG: hypothetical protein ACLGIA_02655 [Actinomycetes bacterium]